MSIYSSGRHRGLGHGYARPTYIQIRCLLFAEVVALAMHTESKHPGIILEQHGISIPLPYVQKRDFNKMPLWQQKAYDTRRDALPPPPPPPAPMLLYLVNIQVDNQYLLDEMGVVTQCDIGCHRDIGINTEAFSSISESMMSASS